MEPTFTRIVNGLCLFTDGPPLALPEGAHVVVYGHGYYLHRTPRGLPVGVLYPGNGRSWVEPIVASLKN